MGLIYMYNITSKYNWRAARVIHRSVTLLLTVICFVSLAACSESKAGANYEYNAHVIRHIRPLLLPPIEGGTGGWCLAVKPGECEVAQAFRGPIVAQRDSGQGPPAMQVATVLTTNEVAGIAIDGGPTIPTNSDILLPDHLRTAAVEVRGGPLVNVPGFGVGPRPLRFTPLGANGEPIRQKTEPQGSLVFVVHRHHWRSPAKALRGPCEIHPMRLPGLTAEGGISVDRTIRSHPGLPARPVLSCVSMSFRLKRQSVDRWCATRCEPSGQGTDIFASDETASRTSRNP